MSDEIESFSITARLDVTLKVNDSDFYKPGAEGTIKFRGLPDHDKIDAAYQYLVFEVIDRQMTGALEKVLERLEEQQKRVSGG
jgi:hypothetical protein